jgi:hypothetical protein
MSNLSLTTSFLINKDKYRTSATMSKTKPSIVDVFFNAALKVNSSVKRERERAVVRMLLFFFNLFL